MSSKTKIVVLRMKEVIYTGIFAVLGILLILLLIFMFVPKNKENNNTPTTVPTMKYIAGVYSAPIVLSNNTLDVEVIVDENHINSIRLVNLSETMTAMYPLMQPSLDSLSEQIYEKQSTDNITYTENSKYTSMLLLNAVDSALDKASIE